MQEITYDKRGRMRYHPDYHPNMGKPWTQSDIEYLCKYFEVDDINALSFALGRTADSISVKVTRLQQQGKYEYYKNLNKYW